jgi:NADPH2:quinone reductase
MKRLVSYRYGPPKDLVLEEAPWPEPGPGMVSVRVGATGLGFVDGLLIAGKYQIQPPLPYVPGSEFAGTVEALGAGVEGLSLGDQVYGLGQGTLAEGALAPASQVYALPSGLSLAQGASLPINSFTALYGLEDCIRLTPGERVLVLGGGGGVGTAAIAVAKALGAWVVAGASSEAKAQAARAAGADAVVNPHLESFREDLKAALGGEGLTVVYDPVGGSFSEAAFRSLCPGGRHLVVGFASGTIPKLPLNLALLKRGSVVGVDWGGAMRADPTLNPRLAARLRTLLESGALTAPPVDARPLEAVVSALEDQLAGAIAGKLVITQAAKSA